MSKLLKNYLKNQYNNYLQQRRWNNYCRTEAYKDKMRDIEIEKILQMAAKLDEEHQQYLRDELLKED